MHCRRIAGGNVRIGRVGADIGGDPPGTSTFRTFGNRRDNRDLRDFAQAESVGWAVIRRDGHAGSDADFGHILAFERLQQLRIGDMDNRAASFRTWSPAARFASTTSRMI